MEPCNGSSTSFIPGLMIHTHSNDLAFGCVGWQHSTLSAILPILIHTHIPPANAAELFYSSSNADEADPTRNRNMVWSDQVASIES